ncbi:MAG: glycoside hydrolase family 3 N-terminal domain-containing protein, partial [Turicibacter sp.]
MQKKLMIMAVFISSLLTVIGCESNQIEDSITESNRVEKVVPEQVIDGIVIDTSMNTLTIEVNSEKQLTFTTSEADTSLAQGLIIGSHVEVTYLGEIAEEDSSKLTVTKIKEIEYKQDSEHNDLAQNILDKMTLEEKVGQVFFVRCPEPDRVNQVLSLNPAGLLLFGRDFKEKEKEAVKLTIQSYQDKSHFPLIIGVDEEGGTVNRVSSNAALAPKPFKSPSDLFAKGGDEAVFEDAKIKGELLLDLGINVNLAPVADISKSERDFIHDRTVGLDAEGTSLYVQSVVAGMKEAGISGTLKH